MPPRPFWHVGRFWCGRTWQILSKVFPKLVSFDFRVGFPEVALLGCCGRQRSAALIFLAADEVIDGPRDTRSSRGDILYGSIDPDFADGPRSPASIRRRPRRRNRGACRNEEGSSAFGGPRFHVGAFSILPRRVSCHSVTERSVERSSRFGCHTFEWRRWSQTIPLKPA